MITYGSTTLTSYNSITKIEVYYYKSSSATALSGGSWSTTKPTWENGKYIWQKARTYYEGKLDGGTAVGDGSYYTESDPVNITGQQGETGAAAYSYKLNASNTAVIRSQTGVYSVSSITFSSTIKHGSESIKTYSGRFIIQTLINGTWTSVYTSSANESSKEYTIPNDENLLLIKCSLYQAGGTTVLLDQMTVPIVKDGIDALGLKDSMPIYLASDKDSGITIHNQGWTRYRPEITEEKKYLWVSYVSRFGDGTTDPILIENSGESMDFTYNGVESPLESVKINLEPIQDFNGYDKPWIGGYGKNLFSFNNVTSKKIYRANMVSIDNSVNDVYLTGAAGNSDNTQLAVNSWAYCELKLSNNVVTEDTTMTLSCKVINYSDGCNGNISLCYYLNDATVRSPLQTFDTVGTHEISQTVVIPAGAYPVLRATPANLSTTFTLTQYAEIHDIQLEIASEPTDFSPYENICPIDGHSTKKVFKTYGKNLFDLTEYSGITYNHAVGTVLNPIKKETNDFIDNGDGTFSWTTTTTWEKTAFIIPIYPSRKMHVKFNFSAENLAYSDYYLDKNYKVLTKATANNTTTKNVNGNMNPPSNACYMCYYISNGAKAAETITLTQPQLEFGTVATEYEPYIGSIVSATLPETIYDGEWDITKGTITINKVKAMFNGSESWGTYDGYRGYYINLGGTLKMKKGTRQDGISNMLTISKTSASGQNNAFWLGVNNTRLYLIGVYDSMGDTLATFKEYLAENPLEIVYPLETPITYQLTPQEIMALNGTNHMYSEGDIINITYYDNQKVLEPRIDYTLFTALGVLETKLKTQIDEKIQTYYQETNPAEDWTTDELKTIHDGDLWYYTGTTTSIYTKDNVYRYNSSNNSWVTYTASGELFDQIDGKSTIYYGKPTDSFTDIETGDYLVDSTDGSSYRYNGSEWIKVTDYKTVIDSIEIGGRNLARNTKGAIIDKIESAESSGAEYAAFDLGCALPLNDNDNISISFDLYMIVRKAEPMLKVYNTNNKGVHTTCKQTNVLSGNSYQVGDVINKRVAFVSTIHDRESSTLPHDYLEFYSTYGTNNFFRISNLKVEKGNKATAWTPAPEDVDSAISAAQTAAAKTATDYLTFTSSAGLDIKSSSYSSKVNIKSDGVRLYDQNGKERNLINADGVSIKDASGNVVASLSNDLTIGQVAANKYNVLVDADSGIKFRKNTTVLAEYGSVIKLYNPTTNNVAVNISSTGASFTGAINATALTLSEGVTIGYSSITGTPTIPTKVSQLTNDSSYLTTSSASSTYATKTGLTNAINNIEIGGVNLISNLPSNWSNGNWVIPSTGSPSSLDTTHTGRVSLIEPISVIPSTDYWLKSHSTKSINILFRLLDSNGNFIASNTGMTNQKWTAPSNCYSVCVTVYDGFTIDDIISGAIKIKFEKGNKATDWSPSPKDVFDSIEIGERNLLLNSENFTPDSSPYNSSSVEAYPSATLDGVIGYRAAGSYYIRVDFPTLKIGETYTFSCDGARPTGLDNEPFFMTINGSSAVNVGTAISGEWTRFSTTFVATSNSTYVKVQMHDPSSGSHVSHTRHFKLERGSKATDWTPAPEDVDVHNYITDIDTNKGITIKPADSSGNDYLQLNSDAISFYKNNVETSRFEDSAIRIGKIGANQNNVYITDSAVNIRNNENVLASFGETTTIGIEGGMQTVTASQGFAIVNPKGQRVFVVGAIVGAPSIERVTIITDTKAGTYTLINDLRKYWDTSKPIKIMMSGYTSINITFGTPSTQSIGGLTFSYDGLYTLTYTQSSQHTFSYEWTHWEDADEQTAFGLTVGQRSYLNPAIGEYSASIGFNNIVSGDNAGAIGRGLNVTKDNKFVTGKYNRPKSDTLFEIGNGTTLNDSSNAFEVTDDGDTRMDLESTENLYIAINALGWISEVTV